jgi:predicted aconitase with swiveling domain
MNNDYVPLGWEAAPNTPSVSTIGSIVITETAADYNPHGLNNDKADHMVKSAAMFAKLDSEQELDFGEAHIYDYRLKDNEVVYGD